MLETEALVAVSIDPLRCELHRQCQGLSDRVFADPAHVIDVVVGGTHASAADVETLVRSCPMNALRLVDTDPAQTHQEI